nr:GntR family transcriptional regulator [Dickeya dadantii]
MKESLYKRIARELAQDIVSGKYPAGSLFPTEKTLCEVYQASRHTVREALRELTEQGLISRRKAPGPMSPMPETGTRTTRWQTWKICWRWPGIMCGW